MTPEIRKAASVWVDSALDVLLPRHCVLCGLASGAQNLCMPCAGELPRSGHSCRLCSLPLTHPGDRTCGRCQNRAPPWDSAIAALDYRFPVDQLICRFKFSRNLACGDILARELCLAVAGTSGKLPTCILPVPLHRTRLFFRSFNQAGLLARHLGKNLGIPVSSSLLLRQRRTRAHSGLDASSRRRNIRGAFSCRIPSAKNSPCTNVALVDDVMTTGATLAECTKTLKKAGAGRVSVWVAARAPVPE